MLRLPTFEVESPDTVEGVVAALQARPGARLRIRAVRDEDSADLRSMAAEGLVPGARVHVAKAQRVAGSVEFSLGGASEPRSVEGSLARQIYVVPDE